MTNECFDSNGIFTRLFLGICYDLEAVIIYSVTSPGMKLEQGTESERVATQHNSDRLGQDCLLNGLAFDCSINEKAWGGLSMLTACHI